jgi:xanthine dehydrogenase FAD-binding subunit
MRTGDDGDRRKVMNNAVYHRPSNLPEALQILAGMGEEARLLAGGTDLVIGLRKGLIHPENIVDISRLDELRGIYQSGDFVHIGALTTHGQIRNSSKLAQSAPLFVEACREVGSVQIRNLGTLGGNLGNASPAGDSLPVLFVLGAEVHLICQGGERWLPVEDFFAGPGKTVRHPNEIIAGVRFRPCNELTRSFFLKIGQRRAVRVSKVSAAGWLLFENRVISDCRLALGAVAPTVIRLIEAEKQLVGSPISIEKIRSAALIAGQTCSPIDDIRSTIEFRRAMAEVLVRRGLEKILHEVKNVR